MARMTGTQSPVPISWVDIDASAARLPFEDRSFDVIIASSVFEYLSDPLTTLHELRRIIRDDGLLLCTVPNTAHRIRRLEAVLTFVATGPIERATSRVSQRLSTYISYLRLSSNRLHVSGWDRLARSAGFDGAAPEMTGGKGAPLLMLRLIPPPTV
jgi:ubiquinone/menaquinone biosynthesis C-methylase UbiE